MEETVNFTDLEMDSWKTKEAPVDDPIGLGERLALIDYFKEELKQPVKPGTTLEELRVRYWRIHAAEERRMNLYKQLVNEYGMEGLDADLSYEIMLKKRAAADHDRETKRLMAQGGKSAAGKQAEQRNSESEQKEEVKRAEDYAHLASLTNEEWLAETRRLYGLIVDGRPAKLMPNDQDWKQILKGLAQLSSVSDWHHEDRYRLMRLVKASRHNLQQESQIVSTLLAGMDYTNDSELMSMLWMTYVMPDKELRTEKLFMTAYNKSSVTQKEAMHVARGFQHHRAVAALLRQKQSQTPIRERQPSSLRGIAEIKPDKESVTKFVEQLKAGIKEQASHPRLSVALVYLTDAWPMYKPFADAFDDELFEMMIRCENEVILNRAWWLCAQKSDRGSFLQRGGLDAILKNSPDPRGLKQRPSRLLDNSRLAMILPFCLNPDEIDVLPYFKNPNPLVRAAVISCLARQLNSLETVREKLGLPDQRMLAAHLYSAGYGSRSLSIRPPHSGIPSDKSIASAGDDLLKRVSLIKYGANWDETPTIISDVINSEDANAKGKLLMSLCSLGKGAHKFADVEGLGDFLFAELKAERSTDPFDVAVDSGIKHEGIEQVFREGVAKMAKAKPWGMYSHYLLAYDATPETIQFIKQHIKEPAAGEASQFVHWMLDSIANGTAKDMPKSALRSIFLDKQLAGYVLDALYAQRSAFTSAKEEFASWEMLQHWPLKVDRKLYYQFLEVVDSLYLE